MCFSNEIEASKNEFRQRAKNNLKKLSSQFDKDTRSMMATVNFADSQLYADTKTIFTFISKKTEINTIEKRSFVEVDPPQKNPLILILIRR